MRRFFDFYRGRGMFLWLVLCNLPYLVHQYIYQGKSLVGGAAALFMGENLVRILAFSLLLSLLFSVFPKPVRVTVVFFSKLLFLLDSFLLYNYHTVLDSGILQILFETNPGEVRDYLWMQKWHILVALLAGNAFFFLLRFLFGKISDAVFSHRRSIASLSLLILVLFSISTYSAWKDEEQSIKREYPRYNALLRLAFLVPEARNEMQSAEYVNYLYDSKTVELTRNESTIPYVVFILGESTSRHHMGLYGYSLPTTPHLSERMEKGELAVFRDVISPHAGTMAVVKTLFSFYNLEKEKNGEAWYDSMDLFDVLRAADYHTLWISNQEPKGFYGTVGRAMASRCDFYEFTSKSSHTIDLSERHDEELFPILDYTLKEPKEKNFYVLHLIGAHEDYKRRYPKEFARFTAEGEAGDFSAQKKTLRAEYDNAILYNDFIVDEIIRRFEDKNAIVIYISDHSEEVYDMGRDVSSHGDETSARQREIPMIIWTSKEFRTAYPELSERILSAVRNPYETDAMIHTLLDLMGIETAEYESEKSILHGGTEYRTLKGGVLYHPTVPIP